VKSLMRLAKNEYFERLASNIPNTSTLWRAINTFTKGYKKSYNASNISADTSNNHFLSVADTHEIGVYESSNSSRISAKIKEFCNRKISPEIAFSIPHLALHEVGTYKRGLKNKKFTELDIDGIGAFLLKLSLPYYIFLINPCIQPLLRKVPSRLLCKRRR